MGVLPLGGSANVERIEFAPGEGECSVIVMLGAQGAIFFFGGIKKSRSLSLEQVVQYVWSFPYIPAITSPPTRSSISLSFKPVNSLG